MKDKRGHTHPRDKVGKERTALLRYDASAAKHRRTNDQYSQYQYGFSRLKRDGYSQ